MTDGPVVRKSLEETVLSTEPPTGATGLFRVAQCQL
jgi:hypothetical protein